jgi:hypothetical protein
MVRGFFGRRKARAQKTLLIAKTRLERLKSRQGGILISVEEHGKTTFILFKHNSNSESTNNNKISSILTFLIIAFPLLLSSSLFSSSIFLLLALTLLFLYSAVSPSFYSPAIFSLSFARLLLLSFAFSRHTPTRLA